MKFKAVKVTAGVLAASMILSFAGCNGGGEMGRYYDNENDPLVFSTLEVDRVFNPFFYTSGTDGEVVGLTQLSMLTNDSKGNPSYGEDEACIVLDYEETTTGTGENQKTEYKFVLKNNVQFSDGTYLSMKDVLFNFYVYLDPVYTGSSTIYSTDIVGLQEYRTQSASEAEQDSFMAQFENEARSRIDNLITAAQDLIDQAGVVGFADAEAFKRALEGYQEEHPGNEFANLVNDFELVAGYTDTDGVKHDGFFMEELEDDWSAALNSYEDTSFSDENGTVYKPFTTDVEVFLYNEGYVSWSKRDGRLHSSIMSDADLDAGKLKEYTKDQAIALVYNDKIPNDIVEVVSYWQTSVTLSTYLANAALGEYYQTHERTYNNISGIRFANRTEPVTVNGTTYAVPEYEEGSNNTHVVNGNEVLSITINKVDPKAIWNFAIPVAPMNYYSDAEHIAAFDYESNFGVEYGSQDFYNNVVNGSDKIGVPKGAGPYAASKAAGGIDNIQAGDFYDVGVIYFERNPYFIMGPAKIKKVRYQVVASSGMLNSLYTGAIDFISPNAKPETISDLNNRRDEGIGNDSITTMGYGYIGVNAGKIPSINVRRAIMHAINVQECVNYYGTEAQAIYRSMSRESWAYPEDATPYYPYIGGPVPEDLSVVNSDYADYVTRLGKRAGDTLTTEEQYAFIRQLVEDAGYTLGANGVYSNGTDTLKITFTIAGEETDHPAYSALNHAREILNECGFQITVKTDAQALTKLTTGDLAVWAAAWSSTIDPDMYQVYHKDSTATSTLNWGYRQIKLNAGGRYNKEYALLDELSLLIEQARETTVQSTRKDLYSQALDIVMEMAIELPTYQRTDLFAYNANKIDETTFTPLADRSAFKGLTSDLYNVSLIVER